MEFFHKKVTKFLLPIPNCMDKSVQDKLDSMTYQGQGMWKIFAPISSTK